MERGGDSPVVTPFQSQHQVSGKVTCTIKITASASEYENVHSQHLSVNPWSGCETGSIRCRGHQAEGRISQISRGSRPGERRDRIDDAALRVEAEVMKTVLAVGTISVAEP